MWEEAERNLLSDGKRSAGIVIAGQEEHASCCGVMRSRRNLERKRKEEAPEGTAVGVRRARDAGRGRK
jgi:hypothetical protein